jgi:hypothetical protein
MFQIVSVTRNDDGNVVASHASDQRAAYQARHLRDLLNAPVGLTGHQRLAITRARSASAGVNVNCKIGSDLVCTSAIRSWRHVAEALGSNFNHLEGQPRWKGVMSPNSYYLRKGAPTKCVRCGQPFRIVDHHMECWRSSNGEFFCSEFCAEDAEEAAFQAQHKQS